MGETLFQPFFCPACYQAANFLAAGRIIRARSSLGPGLSCSPGCVKFLPPPHGEAPHLDHVPDVLDFLQGEFPTPAGFQVLVQPLIAADLEIPDVFRHRGEIPLAVDIKPRFLRNLTLKASRLRKQPARGSAALAKNRKPKTGKKRGSALRRHSRRLSLKLPPEGIVV